MGIAKSKIEGFDEIQEMLKEYREGGALELKQYRAIGTVDECREARERQRAKKPIEYEDKYYACPICNNVLMYKWEKYPSQLKDKKCGLPYCLSCGQSLSWESDTD